MDLFEVQNGPIAGLAPDDWFDDREKSSIWLRIYRTLFVPPDQLLNVVRDFLASTLTEADFLFPGSKLLIGCGSITEMKVPVQTFEMYAMESGATAIKLDLKPKDLSGGNYIFLATAYSIDGSEGEEGDAREFLDRTAGLICLHTGVNFMHNSVFEGEIRLGDGSISAAGPVMKMPYVQEGPFLAKQNKLEIDEIAERVAVLREPKRSRIGLALQLVNSAMRSHYGFFEYWTSLEVVCDGKSQRIRSALAKIYKIKSVQDAGKATGFDTIARWRHEYVHKGLKPIITVDVERYLQLMFLDLLRFSIDLESSNHLLAVQRADGYDLSPLGLENRRKSEDDTDASEPSGEEAEDQEDAEEEGKDAK